MKPENREIFEENRKHYDTLVNAGYMVHLSGRDRSNIVKAMSEEFQPGYSADLWCPTCVANMMHQIYRRYLQFLEEEKMELERALASAAMAGMKVAVIDLKDAEFVDLSPPVVADAPPTDTVIQTKANFPSHKKNHRRP